jgi:hypothetical protein
MQYMSAEARDAAGIADKEVSDGPKRRTLLPLVAPTIDVEPSILEDVLEGKLQAAFPHPSIKVVSNEGIKMVAQLVGDTARQMLWELKLEYNSKAYHALLHATIYAGGS